MYINFPLSVPQRLASTAKTMHWLPNSFAPSAISCGFLLPPYLQKFYQHLHSEHYGYPAPC